MAKTEAPIVAAPRPPTLFSEAQRVVLREFSRLKLHGGAIQSKGCPTCGESACRCNQQDPVAAALQAAGLL